MSTDVTRDAKVLAAYLRAHTGDEHPEGTLSPDIIDRIRDEDLHRLLVPVAYGGAGADLGTLLTVARDLASGSPTTAWVVAAGATSVLPLTAADPALAETVLQDADVTLTWSAGGHATATQSDGGWLISGEFPNCVAAAHATHLVGRASVADSSQNRQVIFVAPLTQASVLQATDVLGLCSSAARTLVLDGAVATGVAEPSASALHTDIWVTSIRHALLGAVLTGAAEIEVDLFAEFAEAPLDSRSSTPRKLDPDYQRQLGKVAARLLAVQLLVHETGLQFADALDPADLDDAHRVAEILRLRGLAFEAIRIARSVDEEVQRTATRGTDSAALLRALSDVFRSSALVAEGPSDEWTVRQLSISRLGL